MPSPIEAFEDLVKLLDQLLAGQAKACADASAPRAATSDVPAAPLHDAIDDVLAAPPRQTHVVSLADSPIMQQFRVELTNGLIQIDTLNQVLRLVQFVLARLPLPA